MVGAAGWRTAPGIRLAGQDLLALRDAAAGRQPRPATRRAGTLPSRRAGSGMDLREIRAYVPGDDPRRMDPSATARTGTPHIRALHEDRDDVTVLIADFRAPMLWGTGDSLRSVRGARYLAGAGWAAVARQGAVGLVVAGGGAASLPTGQGDSQMSAICAMLAERHAAALNGPDQPPLTQGLLLAERMAPRGARVVLATAPDAWHDAEPALARLAKGRRVEVALILDPLEVSPPPRPLPVDCTGRVQLARIAAAETAPQLARLAGLGAIPREVAP
ncbi:DUF58 domain-containing protein [Paracoccus beibuensis]|uniref:DUF58 domain-containing protein n=1 Tax=Paracoccus beibuensis TaxID=547602 RepID=UPI0022404AB6|nr:DUF58 domain-containing protein [Paracoccus beibuensis]